MSVFNYFKDLFLKYRQNDATSKNVFDHYFFDLKYYLHPTASIEDFSKLLNISPDHLNHISKVYYGCLFETLLNEHRYNLFLEELNNPVNAQLTIDSVIKFCGYDNKEQLLDFVKSNNSHSFNN
jgi:AraC-like DNA-binding protein